MTTLPVDDGVKGLVLVHGIGEQPPGAMFKAFLAGISAICPAVGHVAIDTNAWRVTAEGRSFIVYEVHWADLLSGSDVKGTFDVEHLFHLAWYPSINYRLREDYRRTYSKGGVQRWTWLLVGLVPFVYLAHDWGLRFVLLPISERWEKLLDEVPGDVYNFVESAGGAYAARTEPATAYRSGQWVNIAFDRLAPKAGEITDRCLAVLETATRRDGCTELHVLAHSLGTVVVHHALTRATMDAHPSIDAVARITRLYTIGCPLEKIRFFWPRLFEKRVDRAVMRQGRTIAQLDPSLQWDNFWSHVDAVSGALTSFPGLPTPANHAAAGLGGFFTAHVRYLANPTFLAVVLKEATSRAEPFVIPLPSAYARMVSTMENLLAPAAFFGLACLGIVGAGAFSWGAAWVWAAALDWAGHTFGWSFLVGNFVWLKWFFWCGFANVVLLSFSSSAKNAALKSQQACWGPADYRSGVSASPSRSVELA